MEISETNSGKHKHVLNIPEMGIYQVMQELKRYCDMQPCCDGCPFWHDPCNGNFPMALRRIAAKMEHEEEYKEDDK